MTSRIGRTVARLTVPLVISAFVAFGTGTAVAEPGGNGQGGNGQGAGPAKAAEKAAPHSSPGKPETDTSSPQPESNADASGKGANVPGPYDSTRDGSPSENGSGQGKSTGKPCAGCVGKADNKNPPGQLPGGSDPNAGYECDSNKGVGKGNPAHTSCQPTPPGEEPPGEQPPTKKPPAEEPPGQEPSEERPGKSGSGAVGSDTVPPVQAERSPAGGTTPQALPTTGVDVEGPVLIGLASLGTGLALVVAASLLTRARRRVDG